MECTTLWLCCWLVAQVGQPAASPLQPVQQTPTLAAPRSGVQPAAAAETRAVPTPDGRLSPAPPAPGTRTPPLVAPPAASPQPAATIPPAAAPAATAVVPVESRSGRSHAPTVLAALLTPADPQKPAGRWTSLAEVLAAATEPAQQLELTRAYWKLAAALALYRMACDEYELLAVIRDSVGARHQSSDDLVAVQMRRARAAAQLEEASARVLAAQYELGQRIRLPDGAPLPLPADKPHVGTYNTRFDQIYAAAAAPPAARFADRTLELRHSQIDQRAAVVRASEDVLEVEQEFYSQGTTDLATLMSAVDNWAQQRRAFLAAVVQYNAQIADYALHVPRGSLAADSLAGLLIKAPQRWSGAPAQASDVT
ncbi:MAG TPA: hypothetical protein VIK18_21420, partial [Pirellulales bacterium]